jgi:hypothetical protein
MEKNKPPKSTGYSTIEAILNSPDPDIRGSYYAMQRAGKAAIDLAIQTNTAIVTSISRLKISLLSANGMPLTIG